MDSGWWAEGIAVVAALFAGWQAFEARRARTQARAASDEAAEHERAALNAAEQSAGAAQRSAEAQERLAAVAEAQLVPAPLWVARQVSGERWEVVNNTGAIVSAEVWPSRVITPLTDGVAEVYPGGTLPFQWGNRLGAKPFAEVTVTWFTSAPNDPGVQIAIPLKR